MKQQRIGVIGIGKISGIYLDNLTGIFGKRVVLAGLADIIPERAEQAAKEYSVKHFKNAEELIESPDIDIVLNLTQPQHHFDVALKAVNAGKHVYNEKPFCAKREEALEISEKATAKKVLLGSAPDTFMGAGMQTCRKLIDDGWIGKPLAATAFIMSRGMEHWHPAPEFFYKVGGGPMFDMGPYYITALVNLLGPVERICGSAKMGIKQRIITSEPLNGTIIDVEVPTHITGVLDFASGVVGTIITSFEVYSHTLPCIEIYGSEGSLRVPDPNTFGGPVFVQRLMEEKWFEMPLVGAFSENSRGLGITDLAEAVSEGRPHRANGELACHVLDIMHGIHDASASGKYYKPVSSCKRPEPFL